MLKACDTRRVGSQFLTEDIKIHGPYSGEIAWIYGEVCFMYNWPYRDELELYFRKYKKYIAQYRIQKKNTK